MGISTKTTTVTGASDDLVEIDGELNEEFGSYGEDEGMFLGFSDGTLLKIIYDNDGIWRITVVAEGACLLQKVEGSVEKDTFDVVTLTGELRWVLLGKEKALRRSHPSPNGLKPVA